MMMKDIIQVGRREWRRILTRRSQRFLVLLLPVCLFLTLALIYKNGTVADIPVAICDQDHSELSRLLIRGFESTRSMKITAYVQSVDEIRDGFLRGQWHGAVFLPHDLEKSVKTGQPAVVVVYRNDGNLVIGNSILKEALTVSKTVSAGILIKKLRASGITAKQAMNIAAPIQVDTHFLYNPSYNYARYLTPGLLTAMLQMIAMMSAVLLFSTERREKTMDELFVQSGRAPLVMILGKLVPYIMIYTILVLSIFCLLLPALHIAGQTALTPVLLFTMLFVTASAAMGLLISLLVHDQMMATEMVVFISTPAFMFSGYTFPQWGMPALHTVFSVVMPFTWFITGFLKLYYLNAGLHSVLGETAVLLGFVAIAGLASVLVLRRQLEKNYETV